MFVWGIRVWGCSFLPWQPCRGDLKRLFQHLPELLWAFVCSVLIQSSFLQLAIEGSWEKIHWNKDPMKASPVPQKCWAHIYIYKLILSHCFSTWMGSILEESSAQAALKSCWISECSPDSPRPGWSVTQAGQNNSSNSPGKLAIAYLFWRINSKCALNFPGLWMVSRKNRRKGRESKQIKQIKQIPFSDLQPHCPQRGFPNNCTFKELLLCHEKVWSHHSIVSLPTAHINK